MSRGFITLATGGWYVSLAKSLATSYRLFTSNTIPICVYTEKRYEQTLTPYFDKVVVKTNYTHTTLDKVLILEDSPYDETVFLDADMHIINDISFLFDVFRDNGSPLSCVGHEESIDEAHSPIHFGSAAVKAYDLHKYIVFGGGIYYYQKCNSANDCLHYIISDLIPNYGSLQLNYFRNHEMADEPLMELGMLIYGFHPMDDSREIMRFVSRWLSTMSWDMDNKRCSFTWYETVVHPYIVHYGTDNTYTRKYISFQSELLSRASGKAQSKLTYIYIYIYIVCFIRLSIYVLISKNQRKEFLLWIKGHFTKEYWKRCFSRRGSRSAS